MIVDLVMKACHSLAVLPTHSIQVDGAAIGVDDSRPHDLQPILPVGNLGIVDSDQTRPLGNKKVFSSRRIVDIGSDERFDLAGKIRVNSLLENGGDIPTH